MSEVNIKPTSDVTANWDNSTGANHFGEIDEGDPYTDAEYIDTGTFDSVDEFGMEDVPDNTDQVTSITANIRTELTDSSETAKLQVDLFHSGGTPVDGNPKYVLASDLGGYGVLATTTKTWGSLSLTKTQANSIQSRLTFLEN